MLTYHSCNDTVSSNLARSCDGLMPSSLSCLEVHLRDDNLPFLGKAHLQINSSLLIQKLVARDGTANNVHRALQHLLHRWMHRLGLVICLFRCYTYFSRGLYSALPIRNECSECGMLVFSRNVINTIRHTHRMEAHSHQAPQSLFLIIWVITFVNYATMAH